MSGIRAFVMSLFFLFPLMSTGYAARQKSNCPTLPCNSCQCGKRKICGGELRNGNGVLQLPSSGENSCIRCEWSLLVKKNRKVRLAFSQLHLGPGDWVRVYDGPTRRSPLIVKLDTGRQPTDLVTSGRNMMVEFQSDGCGEASRMRASYQATDCGELIRLNPKKRHQKTFVIKSPRFPRLYPSNAHCLWTVLSTDILLSARITVNFIHTEKVKDFVKVYDSLSRKDTFRTYTGRPQSIRTHVAQNSPGLSVQFVSDQSITEKGFKLTIEATSVSMCSRPKIPQNGRTVVLDHERRISIYCCSGYRMVGAGSASATCVNGHWSTSSFPSCSRINSCSPPDPPENSFIEGGKRPTEIGSVVKFRCKEGFQFVDKSTKLVTATCECSGRWVYKPMEPRCESKMCGEPPLAPMPGGVRSISVSMPPYERGTTVNYSCPEGSGLDGIPYRKCNILGLWEPSTKHHKCIPNKHACKDPGTPENGRRRVFSFLDGHMASFGCQQGYRTEGSQYRTCDASNPKDTFWSGVPVICIDLFKSPQGVAAQWRENFVDRTIQCIDEDEETIFSTSIPLKSGNVTQASSSNSLPTATVLPSMRAMPRTEAAGPAASVEVNITMPYSNTTKTSEKMRRGMCRGRSVTVGEGCLNLIYAIDCSKSVESGFNDSLGFVGSSVSLFDITHGQAKVALFTYDDKVYTHFKLGQIKTTEATVKAINSVPFCGGSTATRPVLLKIENEIVKRRNESCRTAVFILSDGNNNWAGNPMDVADRIKNIPKVEIYTIAIGSDSLNWNVLRQLASKEDYFIKVRNTSAIKDAIEKAHDIRIDYSRQCGTSSAPVCSRARTVGGCRSQSGAWPWMVSIYIKGRRSFNFACGGTLIGDCWVLTAAHCFDRKHNVSDVIAVIGDTARFVKEYTETSYEVEVLIVHTQFKKDTLDYDIALLKLKCMVRYKSQIRRGCLPRSGDEQYYHSGTMCIVAGWGGEDVATQEEAAALRMSTTLKHVTLPVQDIGHCRRSTNYTVTNNMICAGSGNTDRDNVNDACKGDSGGPLFCKRAGLGTTTYVIIGIVSWGDGCGLKGQYGYFTDVKKMMPWIAEQFEEYGNCTFPVNNCPTPKIVIV